MDFSLTDDQREIQALAREVAQAEIEPNAAVWVTVGSVMTLSRHGFAVGG